MKRVLKFFCMMLTLMITSYGLCDAALAEGVPQAAARITDASGNITEYASLKDAVDLCKDGDTITMLADAELANGRNNLCFSGEKEVTLLGNGHKITMKADTNGYLNFFIFVQNGAVLNLGKQGDPEASALSLDGRCSKNTEALVYVSNGSTLNMFDGVAIKNNWSAGGTGTSGVYIGSATFNMFGGSIEGNYSQILGVGGAIGVYKGTLNISGGKISHNTVSGNEQYGYGAGIYASQSEVSISGAEISANKVAAFNNKEENAEEGYGGGIMLLACEKVSISDCTITDNYAPIGGAIFVQGTENITKLEIKNTLISGNASLCGGAVYGAYIDITLENTTAAENSADIGGGIFLDENGALTMGEGAAIYNNTAAAAADDIFACSTDTKLTLIDGTVMGNSITGEDFAVNGWFEDFATDDKLYLPLTKKENSAPERFQAAENPVKVSQLVLNGSYACLKAAGIFTVTYTDGTNEEVFADVTFGNLRLGEATPAFGESPTREGYKFMGWDSEIAETVTGDAVYSAVWEKAEAPSETNDSSIPLALLMLTAAAGAFLLLCRKKQAVEK